MKKVAKRAAIGAAAVGAGAGAAAAARTPKGRSVISRVVEQVRDTAGSVGQSVSNMMPGRREEESMGGPAGGTDLDTDMNDEF